MYNETIVDLSRLQFAITALYHFLFVPLTIGLIMIIGIMETTYVMTGKQIWKDCTKFWGKLFAINFAMGVATGITMEFQFGTNWAYYAHFVGDVFGVPLAIEGMMAFFLESTFVGLMIFGWDRLTKVQHLMVTWLTAIGANLSALWILIANAWMQNPVGADFNFETMRMELSSLSVVFFNIVAQAKFVHTISAGYVTGSIFVLSISAYYLLKGKDLAIAKRSLIVASSFGLASALCVVILGDESGYTAGLNQKAKIAAIEAMWETEPAPASLTIFGIPDEEKKETKYAIRLPYVLGMIVTRSLDEKIPGIKEIIEESKVKIHDGLKAYAALEYLLKHDPKDKPSQETVKAKQMHLGYAFLLKKYIDDPLKATDVEISKAANDTVPKVLPMFFSFRIMVGLGLFFIVLFITCFYFFSKREFLQRRWLLKICFYSLPLPWISSELGWIVAEYGRQPWVVEGILPTFLGVSPVESHEIIGSLSGFVIFYTTLLVVDIFLMTKYIRKGPAEVLGHKE
jgi:cytochrome bd ubiquinol oxidase subunit I